MENDLINANSFSCDVVHGLVVVAITKALKLSSGGRQRNVPKMRNARAVRAKTIAIFSLNRQICDRFAVQENYPNAFRRKMIIMND